MYPRTFMTMIIVLFFLLAIVGGGLYVWRSLFRQEAEIENLEPEANETSTIAQPEPDVKIPDAGFQVLGATDELDKVEAGANDSRFTAYDVEVPQGWEISKDTKDNLEALRLTKNNHSLQITQFEIENKYCEFESEAVSPQPQVSFSQYSMLIGNDLNLYRRGWDEEEQEETQEFIYCEKRDEGFFMPTKYGYITSTTPWPADENILLEIDEMIQSLQER